jgi:hypothetical protein
MNCLKAILSDDSLPCSRSAWGNILNLGGRDLSDHVLEKPLHAVRLMPGDLVTVVSEAEILATLDDSASIDGLPFMPEMLPYCGRRMRVYRRADKTCDTIDGTGARRMHDTVHLRDVRCDGSSHGGCQAGCLMFWKEAWLTRIDATGAESLAPADPPLASLNNLLEAGCVNNRGSGVGGAANYRCQITELKKSSEPLAWWELSQYFRDIRNRSTTPLQVIKAFIFSVYRKLTEIGFGYRALIAIYDGYQSLIGGQPFPYRTGTLSQTPTSSIGLEPGQWVRVKSLDEIVATLDTSNKNRGMLFDAEMVRYCGGEYPVLRRVTQILDEKTGIMLEFGNPCIVLKDVYCKAEISKYRLFCPRAIHSYWREIWLEPIDKPNSQSR